MKRINNLWIGLAAVALAFTSCDKDADTQSAAGTGSITVSLVGEVSSRASETADPSAALEAKVFNYKIYVFDFNTGIFEKEVEGNPDGLVTTVTGLSTAGTKRVVVIANTCAGIPTFTPGENYSKFATAAIDLTTQTPALMKTKGLLMTGETSSPKTLVAGSNNSVTVQIRRVVAKVKLRTITIAGDAVGDPSKLTIQTASVQRILAQSTVGLPDVKPVGTAYYGGITGETSQTAQPFLQDGITFDTSGYQAGTPLSKTYDNYFYVFPCVDPNKITLLTIGSMYDNTPSMMYYPIKINAESSSTDQPGYNADGTFIKRNFIYTVDITVKNVVGMVDPDIPAQLADLTVTVVPQQWEGDITQSSEF